MRWQCLPPTPHLLRELAAVGAVREAGAARGGVALRLARGQVQGERRAQLRRVHNLGGGGIFVSTCNLEIDEVKELDI